MPETDFVLVHDDDLMPSNPNVFAWTVDAATHNTPFAVGASGVVVNRALGYWHSQHVGLRSASIRRDVRVDIVKGMYFCCAAVQLARVGYLDLDGESGICCFGEDRRGPGASSSRAREAEIELRAAV